MALPPRIDVHSHFLPSFYSAALASNGHAHPDGMPAIPPWSRSEHLTMMATANVSKSILSISSPGTNLVSNNTQLALDMTRECNAYAAKLKQDDPEKFGFWAALPLPDIEASLNEMDKAVREGADGFGLMTNYHGEYVGSPAFDGIFEKLNRLSATVFIHPTTPCIKQAGQQGQSLEAKPLRDLLPAPTLEFFFDTARAVVNLFISGTIDRCPNITFIIPHAGGALPPLLTRFVTFSGLIPGQKALDASMVEQQFNKQFFFDLAGAVFDGTSGGQGQLKAFVEGFNLSHERLLYGSDFPFTRTQFVEVFAQRMRNGLDDLFDEKQRTAVYEENAKRLLAKKLT
ncbi:hypothetical protein E8E13_008837 [Curvularia kusanoi]|uniref:6-methylsalicylate decarboxylase n=1 Tax=Curvularia kusanoi TaxID=90978 RepID=A0A9P4TNR8_CURKU|nr:hypothetical protein E8E13_008837 [Curvularia kusanoi]